MAGSLSASRDHPEGWLNNRIEDSLATKRPVSDTMNRFAQKLGKQSISLRRRRPEILQVNVGKLCNLTCVHCHVNAGPKRKEIMTRQTVDRIIDWLAKTDIPTVDLTGGAPEMIPDFRYFIRARERAKTGSSCDRSLQSHDLARARLQRSRGVSREEKSRNRCLHAVLLGGKRQRTTRRRRIRRQHRGAATVELVRLRN